MQHPALAFAIHSAAQLVLVVLEIAPADAIADAIKDAMELAPAHVMERVGMVVQVAVEVAPTDAIADAIADAMKDVLKIAPTDAKVATGAPGVLDYNLLLIVVVIALVHVLVLVELVPDAVD